MSSEIQEDHLTISIDQSLGDYSLTHSRPSIFRVCDSLRSVNGKAYDPTFIAIGPFHHGKGQLNNMEHLKIRYLKMLLESRGESSADRYVKLIRELEEIARECYAEEIPLGKDEFARMLLLDGVFLMEFLRENCEVCCLEKEVSEDDPIFQSDHFQCLRRDLLLLENQIPFFVLEELFKLSKIDDQENIVHLIQHLGAPTEVPQRISSLEAPHLLGSVYQLKCLQYVRQRTNRGNRNAELENINSAADLTESGITFEKLTDENQRSWLDIRFEGHKIWIPTLVVSDDTETEFRNLIAYEHYLPNPRRKCFTDYLFFLHCLIHSTKDARLLRRCGVIRNCLGGDEMVYQLINQLGTNSLISEEFSYLDVFNRVNDHCRHRRNRWFTALRRDYFDSPWKLIALVAATVLLFVGVDQLVFAVLSYFHDLKSN